MRVISRQRWTLEDRESSDYHYVPFEVPPGAGTVRVEIKYDTSGAVLDLGVFDPDGFRGYSGGARTGFYLSSSQATPGYLAGELPEGEWNVLIGLYLVPAEGVMCEVSVDTDYASPILPEIPPRPAPRPALPSRMIPASPGRRWVVGDLHSHTVHSDGTLTIDELADRAQRRGLDFLAITDHNTVSHHPHLPDASLRYGIDLIPGQEVTSFSGHANCFGSLGWVDFREPPDRWLAHSIAAGGLMSINHPVDPSSGWHHEMDLQPPLCEVWHTTWDGISLRPIDWWRRHGGIPVGGSDFHSPNDGDTLGSPATFVEVDAERESDSNRGGEGVIGGLAAGRVALASDPFGPVLVRQGEDLIAVSAASQTLVCPDGSRHRIRGDQARFRAAEPGLYRVVEDSGLTLALTL